MKKIIWKCPSCAKIATDSYKRMTDEIQCLCGFCIQIDKMSKIGVVHNCNPQKFSAQFKERYNILQKERILEETVDEKVKVRLVKEIEYMKECQYLGSYEARHEIERNRL